MQRRNIDLYSASANHAAQRGRRAVVRRILGGDYEWLRESSSFTSSVERER